MVTVAVSKLVLNNHRTAAAAVSGQDVQRAAANRRFTLPRFQRDSQGVSKLGYVVRQPRW